MEKDVHHLLWPRKLWDKEYWSKKLRAHPYMQVRIPRESLHRKIHETINSIPVPNEDICMFAWCELDRLLKDGFVDEGDNIEVRLNVLLELLKEYGDSLEVTIATIKWQRDVAKKVRLGPH